MIILIPLLLAAIGNVSIYTTLEPNSYNASIATAVSIVFAVLSGIVVYSYVRYHTKETTDEYFKKFGAKEAIKNYGFSNRLFYVMALLTVLAFGYFVMPLITQIEENSISYNLWLFVLVEAPALALITIALAIIRTSRLKKDFDFYLTRAYFTLASQKEDETEKLKYLNLSLDMYNKFLERKLKLKINNIMRIYSMIISANVEQNSR
jgi:hypothetical protein